MSKLVNGYIAKFIELQSTADEMYGEKFTSEKGQRGELTIWESEKLHPGEHYIRFKPDNGFSELQTSCGKITIENNVFIILTQQGRNKYSFELVEHMQTVDFKIKLPKKYWHICSGCGKRELLSSEEAFNQGWDYPGSDGLYKDEPNQGFGVFAPRTCGDCSITSSLYWKVLYEKESANVTEETLAETIKRIEDEPWSLIPSEDEMSEIGSDN